MNHTIECVLDTAPELGECPVWVPEEAALYWTDIYGRRFHRFDPASGTDRAWPVKTELASFALCDRGGLIVAFHKGFAYVDLEKQTLSWLARPLEGDDRVYLNDGRCDRSGKFFWAGSTDRSKKGGIGALFRISVDGRCERMADDIISSNGIAFSPDNRVLYYADTRKYRIWRFDYDPASGALSNRSIFVQLEQKDGLTDGAAVDSEGHYWCARVHTGKIVRHRPDGSVEREIEMPTKAPTMVAFGGDDLKTLYVTTSRRPLDPAVLADDPKAGSLFALRVDVPGLPEPRFKLGPELRQRPSESLI